MKLGRRSYATVVFHDIPYVMALPTGAGPPRKKQIAWVRAANQHRAIAEEIILKELIYV